MRLSRFFIDRPIFAAVISIFMMIVGGIAYVTLPIAQFPEIVPPPSRSAPLTQVRAPKPWLTQWPLSSSKKSTASKA